MRDTGHLAYHPLRCLYHPGVNVTYADLTDTYGLSQYTLTNALSAAPAASQLEGTPLASKVDREVR